jgi:WD40 repeat protein
MFPAAQGGAVITSLAVSPNGDAAAFSVELGTAFLEDDKRAHGIQLSRLDDSFNPKVNQEDIDFIVVQATDGLQVDDKFKEFLEPIQAVPIRGAMHFFQPDEPWQEQADLFLSAVKDKGFHFYALGLEVGPDYGSTTFLSDAQQWLKYVDERVEQKILLQTGSFFITSFGPSGDWMKEWPLLIMDHPPDPDPNGNPFLPQGVNDWKIWQYSVGQEMGAQYGVGRNSVLLEVYNGSPLDMWEWLELPAFSIYNPNSDELIHPSQAIRVTGLNGIAFSPDGAYVAAAGEGLVSLLDAGLGEEITSLSLMGRTTLSVSFTSDGRMLAIGTEGGTVLLWDLSLFDRDIEAEPTFWIACSLVNRDFTDSELQQFFGDPSKRNTCLNVR